MIKMAALAILALLYLVVIYADEKRHDEFSHRE